MLSLIAINLHSWPRCENALFVPAGIFYLLKLKQGKIPKGKCGGDTPSLMSTSPLRLFFTGDGACCSVCHVFALPSNNPFTLCASKSHQFPARLEHNQLLCSQAAEIHSQDNNPACAGETIFCTFLCYRFTTRAWNCLISRFIENLIFICIYLSLNLDMVPRGVAYFGQSKVE